MLEKFEKILKCLDENSIEKLHLLLFLENLLLKIEPSEIRSFFYNNFFGFRGGGLSPLSLLATPLTLSPSPVGKITESLCYEAKHVHRRINMHLHLETEFISTEIFLLYLSEEK